MSGARRRTAVAAALVAAIVGLPCTAWYLAGSRAAHERARAARDAPIEEARQEGAHLADLIALRLESLREAESARPFHEYLDPGDLPELGCPVGLGVPSPLASGPADPLVWAHFQIDDVGILSMPTLPGDGAPGDASGSTRAELQEAIYRQLECASAEHLSALHRDPAESGRRVPSALGIVTVGPFSWHSATIGDGPSLVAIREVATPAAVLTQGFVVPAERLETLLGGSIQPATIRPGLPSGPTEVPVPVAGDPWCVVVDAGMAIADAERQASAIVRRFHGLFAVGVAIAALFGGAVLTVVRQSDRLAEQRFRFAAAAAHELRTPLAGLQLYGEMLGDGVGDAGQQREYAHRIAEEAARLGRVVQNVLGVSRLERGGAWVRPRPGDLAETVRAFVERASPALARRGADLRLTGADRPCPCRFDPQAVDQILQNLVDNAEKFSRGREDRTIDVVVERDGSLASLSVLDRGRGIAPAMRGRLFRPFVGDRSAAEGAGLGLGLALVAELARQQGARVRYLARDGEGSRFIVEFPAPEPA